MKGKVHFEDLSVNLRIDLKVIGWEGEDRVQFGCIVNIVRNRIISWYTGILDYLGEVYVVKMDSSPWSHKPTTT
jgi:hypothetical protein